MKSTSFKVLEYQPSFTCTPFVSKYVAGVAYIMSINVSPIEANSAGTASSHSASLFSISFVACVRTMICVFLSGKRAPYIVVFIGQNLLSCFVTFSTDVLPQQNYGSCYKNYHAQAAILPNTRYSTPPHHILMVPNTKKYQTPIPTKPPPTLPT